MAFGVGDEIQTREMTIVQLGDDSCRIQARGKFSDKDAEDYVPNPESEQLRIDVPAFEGPLDLLLHLIKKHSMDIFDIPIVLITRKYLEALDQITTLDLDLAGEFLLMAATLTQIKSKMLLPPDEQSSQEGDDEDAEDPRAELVRRLLEYQKFKQAASALKDMHAIEAEAFSRRSDNSLFLPENDERLQNEALALISVEVFELIEFFAKAIEKNKPKLLHSVQFEKVSVRARLAELIDFSRIRLNYNFDDALRYFNVKTKIDVIVTFLAVLEMARLKLVTVEQGRQNATIFLSAVEENLWGATELFSDLDKDTE